MAYSEDLRKRVIAFVQAGGSKAEVARVFKVSRACVYVWLKRACLKAEKCGPKSAWKLDEAALKAHVEANPDAYQHERAAFFGVCQPAICHALRRLNLTRKKNRTVRREKLRES